MNFADNIRTVERDIDGNVWSVTLLPADEGLDLLPELVGYAGPAVGKALASLQGEVEVSDLEQLLPAMGEGLQELARALARPEAAKLVKRLVTRNVRCDGIEVKPSKESFGLIFAGRYATLLKVAGFVIEVNFHIPLSSWASAAGGLLAAARRAPTSGLPASSDPS